MRLPSQEVVADLKRQYPKQPGQIFAVCIGRLEKQKGHRYLISAVARLPETYRKRLLIFFAGDGSLEAELKKQISRERIDPCFVFLGYTRQIPEFLSLCDFMILPSLWEGLPLSILEAYSLSRPVIATDIPGTRESLKDKVEGSLVAPTDEKALAEAIRHWMDAPEEIVKMGKAAYQRWRQEFSFEKMVEDYHWFYEKVLKGKI